MFKLDGTEEVLKVLKSISADVANKEVKKALRAGASVVRRSAIDAAKRIDDSDTREAVYKNIAIKGAKGNHVRVGVLGGAKRDMSAYGEFKGKGSENPGGDTWYWRFIEFGVPAHGIPARPFLRPALEANQQAVIDKIIDRLVASIS